MNKPFRMKEPLSLRTADLVTAEVWAYSPPQDGGGFFSGRKQRFRCRAAGIQLDDDMWWSVTPEQLADHTADRCRCDLLLDGFAGAGGNSIAFAKTCGFVVCCEIDSKRLETAKANASVYGHEVTSRLDFIIGDFATLTSRQLRKNAFDVVFMSPPWGGPEYNGMRVFDLRRLGDEIDFRRALRLAQRVAPRVAAFLPRTVPLLTLLEASAVFEMRNDASEATESSACHDLASAQVPTAPKDEGVEATVANKSLARLPARPLLHVELALRRSRRDADDVWYRRFDCSEDYDLVANSLNELLSKATSEIRSLLPADAAKCDAKDQPSAKRRRTMSNGESFRIPNESNALSAHDRRWETAEAAEEEARLLDSLKQMPSTSCIAAAVVEKLKVYQSIDQTPRDWRLLPVEVLWAAAPFTKGLVRDPLARLSRRMQSRPEAATEAESPEEPSNPERASRPLMHALLKARVPCVCEHIAHWGWRAVGVTAYFGSFEDIHNRVVFEPNSSDQPLELLSDKGSPGFLVKPERTEASVNKFERLDTRRQRRYLKVRIKALLLDALTFTGLNDRDSLETTAAGGAVSTSKGSPTLDVSAQTVAKTTETSAEAEEEDCNPEQSPNANQIFQHMVPASLACFARQVVSPCRSRYDRCCNCFFSVEPASAKAAQNDWRAFTRRLISSATDILLGAQKACRCRRCSKVPKPLSAVKESKNKCAWRSALWTEIEKLIHSYLTGASACSAKLHLALATSSGAFQSRKPGTKFLSKAVPLRPAARAQFLCRVVEAYESVDWGSKAAGTAPISFSRNEETLGQPVELKPKYYTGSNAEMRGCQTEQLWTPQEVLHWQFGCSMWCNSGLRLLVARHLAPLFV